MRENEKVEYIGKLDKEKLGKYKDKLIAEEVILTLERIIHIKQHHPGDYEKYGVYIKSIIDNLDYILDDSKNIDTILYIKRIVEEDRNIQLVGKLNTNIQKPNNKNSILTLWKVRDKTFKQLLRNREHIYKNE